MLSASVFIQQNIKRIIRNDSNLYITPNIPEKKLNNATKAYNVDASKDYHLHQRKTTIFLAS